MTGDRFTLEDLETFGRTKDPTLTYEAQPDLDQMEVAFCVLVQGVRLYADAWTARDIATAEERAADPDSPDAPGVNIGALVPTPRWELTLQAIAENIEMDPT